MVNLIFDPHAHFHQESKVVSNKTPDADSKLIQLFFSQIKSTVGKWNAVAYSKTLKYIGKIVREMGGTVTANFLDRRTDGDYQLKKEPEEVEQELVFMRDVQVVWQGPGRLHVENEKEVKARLTEHWQSRRMRQGMSLISLPQVSAKSVRKKKMIK